jgi:hypothetical protein
MRLGKVPLQNFFAPPEGVVYQASGIKHCVSSEEILLSECEAAATEML